MKIAGLWLVAQCDAVCVLARAARSLCSCLYFASNLEVRPFLFLLRAVRERSVDYVDKQLAAPLFLFLLLFRP